MYEIRGGLRHEHERGWAAVETVVAAASTQFRENQLQIFGKMTVRESVCKLCEQIPKILYLVGKSNLALWDRTHFSAILCSW